MSEVLKITNLRRIYRLGNGREVEVLRGIDLKVDSGEIIGLIGPSGSGKSSLLHAAGLLESCETGQITINGQDYTGATDKKRTQARLNIIGFVYQFHHLLPEYTALGNVALPLNILGVPETKAHDRARELLEKLGLKDRMEHQPAQLSGGEQQRVAIARAMANKPSLILADEPTGNLDPDTSFHVFDAFKSAVKESKTAVIIATHNLELAGHMDRVFRLDQGHLTPFNP
jgi:lipoprotein-releasing system ATP-binding protein